MGTCNFKTSKVFDNYCAFYEEPSEDVIKDIEADGETFDRDFDEELFYNDIFDNFKYIKDDILNKNNIYYFDIKLTSGYYDGVMLEVIPNKTVNNCYNISELEDPDNIDSEWLGYNLSNWKPNKIYSSQIKRAMKSEINIINKKVLPKLAEELGFKKFGLVGVFSNGEGVYEFL